MKNKFWIMALAAMAIAVSGCSRKIWSSENKLDQQTEVSRFGEKEYEAEQAEEDGEAYEKGRKKFFTLGGKDSIFNRGKSQSEEQVRGDKLFAGALDVVLGLPIKVASREGGLVSTDWKINPEKPTDRYRVNIRVSGREPYGEVRVVVLRQSWMGNTWVDQAPDKTAGSHIAKNIRKRAQVVRP